MKEFPPPDEWPDHTKCPAAALMLYYANSGKGRFTGIKDLPRKEDVPDIMSKDKSADNVDEWLESDNWSDEQQEAHVASVKNLVQEIRSEAVTDAEKVDLLTKAEAMVGRTNDILSCASCGHRNMLRDDNPNWHWYNLESPEVQHLKMSEEETACLKNELSVTVRLPVNSEWEQKEVRPHAVKSYFFDDGSEDGEAAEHCYHLHREFVEDHGDSYRTCVCAECDKHLSKGKIPPLSLACGVDFGSINRLTSGTMTMPNIMERAILSRIRLYQAVVKMRIQGTKFTRHFMKSHAISFSHDAPEKALELLDAHAMNDPKKLCETIQLMFVGPKEEAERMVFSTFRTSLIAARPFVIVQWARLLKQVNVNHKDLEFKLDDIDFVKGYVEECHNLMKDQSESVTDDKTIRSEEAIGDDIAKVRCCSNMSTSHDKPTHDTSKCGSDDAGDDNGGDELPVESLTHTFVTTDRRAEVNFSSATETFVKAAGDVFPGHSQYLNNNDSKSETDSNGSDPSVSQEQEGPVKSKRSAIVLSEYEENDKIITMAFPTIFLLGNLYNTNGKKAGPLKHWQRKHIFNQFTTAAGSDPNLNFLLCDQLQRHSNINGVNAKLKGNYKSFQKFAEYTQNEEFNQELAVAVKNPSGKEARKIAGKVLPILRASSKSPFGALESSQAITKIFALTRRFGSGSTFLTVSPDDVKNPTSYRLTYHSTDNKSFPAKVSEDFFEKLQSQSTFITEHNVSVPTSFQHMLKKANGNPIATTTEFYNMLNALFEAIVGMPPNALDQGRVKKSKHYLLRENGSKGIFGSLLAAYGVIEESRRRSFHLHIILWGGLPPRLLQKAAAYPYLWKEVTKVLETMYCSQISRSAHLKKKIEHLQRERDTNRERHQFIPLQTLEMSLQKPTPEGKEEFQRAVDRTISRTNDHVHSFTCRKPPSGAHMCRAAMPKKIVGQFEPKQIDFGEPDDDK